MKKRTKIWLTGALAACVVFSLVASIIQSNFGRTKVTNSFMSLSQIAEAIKANNASYGRNIEVTFSASAKISISFKLFVPQNATAENPAPAIVAMPGGLANKEHYLQNSVEWSRRGYVVLAFDPMGHGKTDRAVDDLTHNSMGMEAVTEYVMSLPFVNVSQVGVTGHSWGNDGAVAVINAINLNSSNPRIAAFLQNQGSLAYFSLKEGAMDNVLYGFSVGKYDEMDVVYWNAYTLPSSEWAIGWIKEIYPEFSGTEVSLETWFTPAGGQTLQEGTKINAKEAYVLYNPHNTHPAALFSRAAAHVNINFFYGAFGVPGGASYIPSSNQIWYWMVMFSVLGMFSWFALVFPLFDLLLQLPVFCSLAKEVKDRASLPLLKTKKEAIPLIIMFLCLTTFAGGTLVPLTATGAQLIPTSPFFPSASHQANAFGYWSFIVALVALVSICIVTGVKRLLYRDDLYTPPNPLIAADVGIRIISRAVMLGFTMAVCMYGFLFLIEKIFCVDFRIATVEFPTFRLNKIYVILRYAVLYGLFYVINAVLVANTRYKDIPDWASTGIVVLGNTLGIIVFIIVQYSHLIQKGTLYSPLASSTCTVLFSMLCPMIVSPIFARYTFNRTGIVWPGAAFSAFLFTAALVGTGQYMVQDITMFGL
jgi:pimeloyl-ACP methyl ester carboxylesterase